MSEKNPDREPADEGTPSRRPQPPSPPGAVSPKIIPVEELRKGGTRFVRVLDRPTLEWIVGRAVAAASRLMLTTGSADPKASLAAVHAAAREEVRRALKQEEWLAPSEEAARRKRNALERTVVRLREELGHTVLRLRLLRSRPTELDCRSLGPEAVEGLSARTRQLLTSLVASGELRTPAGDPFGAAQGFEVFRRRFDEVVTEVVKEERRRLNLEVDRARDERVAALEQRVSALGEELARREQELAQPDEEEQALPASPFRVPPKGLKHDDPFFMWRWRYLNWVFLENVELQGRSLDDELGDPQDLLAPVRPWVDPAPAPEPAQEATPDEPPLRSWIEGAASRRRSLPPPGLDPAPRAGSPLADIEPAPVEASPPLAAGPDLSWASELEAVAPATPTPNPIHRSQRIKHDSGRAAGRAWLYEALGASINPDEEGA